MLTEILDQNFARVGHNGNLHDNGATVLESLLGRSVKEANSVRVTDFGLFGNGLLHILNCGASGELDVSWKALDGLLRSCRIASGVSKYVVWILGVIKRYFVTYSGSSA